VRGGSRATNSAAGPGRTPRSHGRVRGRAGGWCVRFQMPDARTRADPAQQGPSEKRGVRGMIFGCVCLRAAPQPRSPQGLVPRRWANPISARPKVRQASTRNGRHLVRTRCGLGMTRVSEGREELAWSTPPRSLPGQHTSSPCVRGHRSEWEKKSSASGVCDELPSRKFSIKSSHA
jgi:hypothetical protein